jgi:hypothetical protein
MLLKGVKISIFTDRNVNNEFIPGYSQKYDILPKNHIFPILGGAREIFGVFHVKNHDFTPKKSYFYQF